MGEALVARQAHEQRGRVAAGARASAAVEQGWSPAALPLPAGYWQHYGVQMKRDSGLLGLGMPAGYWQHYGMAPGGGAVQMRGEPAVEKDAGGVHEAAQRGLQGPAGALPHLDAVQRSFGRHDAGAIRAHVGGPAQEASRAMGALAYATGDSVAFRDAPDLHTAAHEAAHVVQQRGGVQLKAGVGEVGDQHERHADAVADLVVQGKSSEALLDEAAGPAAAVQRVAGPVQMQADPLKTQADTLIKEMQPLIDGAVWKEIRKRVYPKESAAGIQRAKDRKDGKQPDLSGLGRIAALNHFAAAVRKLQGAWTTFTPSGRLGELAKAANAELSGAGVAEFLVVDKESLEIKGYFSRAEWKFVISEQLITGASLPDADAAEVCNLTLHESRHAEQAFLSARYSAGVNKKDAAAITAEQNIPRKIADLAVAQKFDAKTDPVAAELGKKMYQARVTDGANNQAISNDDGWAEMATLRAAAKTALEHLKAAATAQTVKEAGDARDALKKQVEVVEKKYSAYRNIPYEADAHEVGDAAEQAFKGAP